MLLILIQEKSKLKFIIIIIILIIYSTLKWKSSVDEVATFLDGGKIPFLLVENKVDLLDGDEVNEPDLQQFAQNNGFCGNFKTSAKTGLNITESMEYLIKYIIKRMENMESKGNEVFTKSRISVTLDPEKYNQVSTIKRKPNNNGCC